MSFVEASTWNMNMYFLLSNAFEIRLHNWNHSDVILAVMLIVEGLVLHSMLELNHLNYFVNSLSRENNLLSFNFIYPNLNQDFYWNSRYIIEIMYSFALKKSYVSPFELLFKTSQLHASQPNRCQWTQTWSRLQTSIKTSNLDSSRKQYFFCNSKSNDWISSSTITI